MHNNSGGGIYFEYDHAIQPGVDIDLKILDSSMEKKDRLVPIAHKSHRARVKWCRQLKDSSAYGIGAQYFADEQNLPFIR